MFYLNTNLTKQNPECDLFHSSYIMFILPLWSLDYDPDITVSCISIDFVSFLSTNWQILSWGVRDRVVKVIDFKPLASHCCGFESRQGLWILSCEEAIQLAYGTSVPEIIHGRATWDLPQPVKLERRHMTYSVSL
jgi:hypothetical protein